VSLNNIIGFKHKSTGYCLHSHNTNNGKVTPISKQQQGIVQLNKGGFILLCIYCTNHL
jgi:hypothetical protein